MINPVEAEQDLIRQYLLGALDDESNQQFEENLFANREYFEKVLMTEDELVEDFVFDALSPSDRERFLSHYLSQPEHVRKLKNTRALVEYSRSAELKTDFSRTPGFLRKYSIAAGPALACLLIVGVSLWLITRNSLQREIARLNEPGSTLETKGDFEIALTPIRVRTTESVPGDDQVVKLPAGTQVAQLRIPVTENLAREYRAELRTGADERLVTVGHLRATSSNGAYTVPLRLPTKVLQPGVYLLILRDQAGDDTRYLSSFTFRVAE
jgi:hypothetical protein